MRSRGRSTSHPAVPHETPLVDREGEVAQIEAALSRVAGGESGIIVLTGLAGTGKTRLAQEALRLAASAGFSTFTGHADELGRDTAYAPFTEALGTVLRDAEPEERSRLLDGLDQLALVFGGLGIDAPRPLKDPSLERARLMDGFARLVDRLARRHPIAILIDDAHAIDDGSSELLRHITLTVTDQPVLLVLTSQPDGPGPPRLARLRARLSDSSWWLEEIPVTALDVDASAVLLARILGGKIAAGLRDVVVERCAGRPLYLEAVGRSLAENDELVRRDGVIALAEGTTPTLPRDIKDQLSLRLRALTANERRIVRLLAVAGGRCEYRLLVAAGKLGQDQLIDALDRLGRRKLLAEESETNTYALAHGLLQQAALADLSGVQIRRTHADLAAALEQKSPDDPRIAEHLIQAGSLTEPGQTLPKLVKAGRRARALGAMDDATRCFVAAGDLGREQAEAPQLLEILIELGSVCRISGHRADAGRYWSEALGLAQAQGDPETVSRLNRELGNLAWTDGDVGTADRHYAAAERALAGLEPSPEHAELLSLRIAQAMRTGDATAIDDNSAQLRELAARLDLPDLAVRAALAEAARALTARDFVVAEEKSQDALTLALDTGDPFLTAAAYDQLSIVVCLQGDLGALRRYSKASLDIVRQLGARAMEPWPRMRLVIADLLSGDWDAAMRGNADVIAIVTRYGEPRGLVSTCATYAWLLVHRGRLDDAHHYLEMATQAARPTHAGEARSSSILAVAGVALSLAEDMAAEAADLGSELTDLNTNWFGLVAAMQYGDALAAAGRTGDLLDLIAEIRGLRSCSTVLPEAIVSWLEGTSDPDAAPRLLKTSAQQFDQLGFPFYAAKARLALAEAVAAEDQAEAIRLAESAQVVFDRLQAPIQAQATRRLLRSLGVVPSRGHARELTEASLSPRELEVARLVASGKSNADVATALFISPRTVTTHLDRMYQRLGLNSRAALTRYLADSGLLETTT